MFTDTQREKKFEQANDIQRILYDGPEAGIEIYEIAKKHSIAEAENPQLAIAIGDVILGLVPQEKLPELLVGRLSIERAAAMRITADVLDFLAPLDQPETAETATSVPINNAEPANDNSLASEIAEAEAAMESMQPIRTMSHDMEIKRGTPADEPTHTGASQADLLDRTATVKDKNPGATWGTEQT